MKIQHLFLSLLLAFGSLNAMAAQRSPQQLQQAAQQQMTHLRLPAEELCEVYTTAQLSVFASDRGYVVVSANDALPVVLGYSQRPFSTDNPGFKWWLSAIDEACSAAPAMGVRHSYSPLDWNLADHVDPLLTSLWGQTAPYNNLCPMDVNGRCVTGCVATAMSQVMYTHQWPRQGQGTHSMIFTDDKNNLHNLTFDYGATTFDWDNMLDDYSSTYTTRQAKAVATLMYAAGVSVDMDYSPDGSGAIATYIPEAFHNYFDYPQAQVVYRNDGRDEQWCKTLYDELSDGAPVIYNGIDMLNSLGHSFVVDGYDSDGLVHVNWGWDGSDNGYFDFRLLNPDSYSFTHYQTMIIGMRSGEMSDDEILSVSLSQPGTLSSQLSKPYSVTRLSISGPLNADDLVLLRAMAGRDQHDAPTFGSLQYLDLSQAQLPGDSLPSHVFYRCNRLMSLTLPQQLQTISDGALAMCKYLRKVTLPASGSNYKVIGNAIYSTDGQRLIVALPSATDTLCVADGVVEIAPEAFSGCAQLKMISVPATVSSIGDRAFANCTNLTSLRMSPVEVPAMGKDVVEGIRPLSCKVYVFGGSKKKYLADGQWAVFKGVDDSGSISVDFDNIVEFGTTLTARNAIREQGQANPRLSYKIEGEAIVGIPKLSCNATPESPVGTYPIIIERGTVTNPELALVNGILTVIESTSAIEEISNLDGEAPVTVYAADGRQVLRTTAAQWPTVSLPSGIYIINGKTYLIRKR